jgi:hypothetical protein
MPRRTSLIFLFVAMTTATAAMSATTYPQPLPSSFSPTSGPPGTVITVNGTGFTGLNAVWIGNAKDSTVYVMSDKLVKVTVPTDATTGHLGLINPQRSVFTSTNFTVSKTTSPAPAPTPTTGAASVSGAVTGLANAAVEMTGPATRVATANSSGAYSFAGVATGTYTVAPTTAGHVFTPTSLAANVTSAAVSNVNFTGSATSLPT